MTDPLLTIGAFARAAGLTPTALRHYDEVGLLRPADVDAATGYRYYTPDLVRRAQLIARMRAIGLPIEVMRTVLDGPADAGSRAVADHVGEQAQRTAQAVTAAAEIIVAAAAGRAVRLPVTLRVDGPELAAALRQVRVAADADRSSPLGSVLLDAAATTLDVVATNRYWMARRTVALTGPPGTGRAVLGLDAATALAGRLDRGDEVELAFERDRLVVTGRESEPDLAGEAPVDLASDVALRDVAFPDHRAVIAGLVPPRARALVDRAALAAAVGSPGREQVDLTFTDRALEVSAEPGPPNPVAAVVAGSVLTVRLGSSLLTRLLAAAVGPEVLVAASASDRPVVVRAPYQRGFLALLMPIRPA